MNYRHSFHAGNSADVVKHSLLIALVRALQQKEGPLTLIDTHAGCGMYDLNGDAAQRTGEAMPVSYTHLDVYKRQAAR